MHAKCDVNNNAVDNSCSGKVRLSTNIYTSRNTELYLLLAVAVRRQRDISNEPVSKAKFSHSRYRALGPELIPVYRESARRWLEAIHPAVGCFSAITFRQACGYLSSRRASPPIGRYQIILLCDRGTCVWAACPMLLPGSVPAEIRTRDFWDRERTLYR